ncbi:ferredoxin Fer [Natrononativus amylolyticus]|uniref:ferredoxin Fer n=1 Tax=Natrononativus amylolyticus TaxID=2963434 RepID=UPI0026F33F1B|nr:ferredoxin Fer [Natrononativus amylolyticus]
MESPFDVLRIAPDADKAEIEQAYRRRAMETHPDQGGSATAFQAVKAAYDELIEEYEDGGRTEVEPEARQEDRPTGSRVEYLNYEVLDDHGWTLEDDDLFEKAAEANLAQSEYGRLWAEPDETLLEAAEKNGFTWPFACRGGACANCAVAVVEGDLTTPVNHVLPQEMIDRGIRLSCVGAPVTDDMKVVFNVKHLPSLDDLRLPPRPFEQAQLD